MTCEKVLIINQGKIVAYDDDPKAGSVTASPRALARRDLHQADRGLSLRNRVHMRNTLADRSQRAVASTSPPRWAYVVFTAMAGPLVVLLHRRCSARSSRCRRRRARSAGRSSPPDCRRVYKNLTDGVVVQLWGVMFIITLFVAPVPLDAAVRRGEAAEDVRAADDRAGAADRDRARQVPGRPGHHLRHARASTIVFPLILAVFGSQRVGQRAGVVDGAAGLRRRCCCGAPPAWRSAMFISSLTESQMVAALLTFAVLLPWMLLRGAGAGRRGAAALGRHLPVLRLAAAEPA